MNSNRDNTQVAAPSCPICRKPAVADYTPFCSKRCADIDLHRWLSDGYAIPAVETDDSEEIDESGGER